MPTTLTGLLLFVVMLLPGFAYLVGKERHGTERRLSPFRETVAVVAASITSELAVLVVFAGIRTLWPSITPNIGALVRDGGVYLRGSQAHHGRYGLVAAWAVGLLAVAAVCAYVATVPRIRRIFESVTGPYPHDSTVSAWWILFERWPLNRNVELACMLDDGSGVRGRFGSFNISADDSPDRDLILQEPIYYRPPGAASGEVLYDVSAVCCPASRIVALFVNYSEPSQPAATLSQEPVLQPTAPEPEAVRSSEASTQALAQPSSQLPAAGLC
jgi:Family of unknown function (DUF6338)